MSTRKSRVPLGANPYVAGPPVYGEGPFVGRKDLLDRMDQFVKSGGRLFVLQGSRRIGKTSLLRHFHSLIKEPLIPVYGQMPARGESPHNFIHELALGLGITPPEGNDLGEQLRSLGTKLPGLATRKKRVILVIDCPAEGVDVSTLQQVLVLGEVDCPLSLLLCVGGDLQQVGGQAGLPPGTEVASLAVFSTEETRQLIVSPLMGMLSVEDEAILQLVDLSGCHPAVVQSLCYETFESVRARPVETITMMEVVLASRRLDMDPNSFAWLWQGLTSQHQLVMAAMAEAAPIDRPVFVTELTDVLASFQVDLKGDQLAAVIDDLVAHELLRREAPGRLAFSIELLRRWISRHHPMERMSQVKLEGSGARAVAQRHLQTARDAHVLGNLPRAIDSYRRAMEAEAGLAEAQLGLGRALGESGKFAEAAEVLRDAQEVAPEDAREELIETYLRWIDHQRTQNLPYDDLLAKALTLAPDQPQLVQLLRAQRVVSIHQLLRGQKNKELIEAVDQLALEADIETLHQLNGPLLAQLDHLLDAREGRSGRWVPPYIEVLLRAYPDDPQPLLKYARALLSEAEVAEAKAPPTAQSFFRKAERVLDRLPGGTRDEELVARLEKGRERLALVFFKEKEVSLQRLVDEKNLEAAASFARELLAERDSTLARLVLDSLQNPGVALRQGAADSPSRPSPSEVRATPEFAPSTEVKPTPEANPTPEVLATAEVNPTPEARANPEVQAAASEVAPVSTPVVLTRRVEGPPPTEGRPRVSSPATDPGEPPRRPLTDPTGAPRRNPQSVGQPRKTGAEKIEFPPGWSDPGAARRPGIEAPVYPPPPPPAQHNTALWAGMGILGLLVIFLLVDRAKDEVDLPQPPAAESPRFAAQAVAEATPFVGQVPSPMPATPTPLAEVAPTVAPGGSGAPPQIPATTTVAVLTTPAPVAVVPPVAPQVPADALAAAEAASLQGRQNMQRGAYQSALQSYQRSLEFNPNQPATLQELGLIYYTLKRYGEAATSLEKALALDPSMPMVRFDLGKVYRAQGRTREAKNAFELALKEGKLPSTLADEARAYINSSDNAEEKPAAKSASASSPSTNTAAPEPTQAPQLAKPKATLWGDSDTNGGGPIQLFGNEPPAEEKK